MKTWNERLLARLVMLDMKPAALATAVGVSATAVSYWVRGKVGAITQVHLERVCSELRINRAWLLNGDMPMESDPVANGPDPQLAALMRLYSAAPDWVRAEMVGVCRWLIAVDQERIEPVVRGIRSAVFDDAAQGKPDRDALWRAFAAADDTSRDLALAQLGLLPGTEKGRTKVPAKQLGNGKKR